MYSPSITVRKAAWSFLRTAGTVGALALASYYSDSAHIPAWAAPVSGLITAAMVGLGNWIKHN